MIAWLLIALVDGQTVRIWCSSYRQAKRTAIKLGGRFTIIDRELPSC